LINLTGQGLDLSNTSELTIKEIALFPNPTSGKLIIELEQKKTVALTIVLFDMNGAKVGDFIAEPFSDDKWKVDLSALSEGPYILQIDNTSLGKPLFIKK